VLGSQTTPPTSPWPALLPPAPVDFNAFLNIFFSEAFPHGSGGPEGGGGSRGCAVDSWDDWADRRVDVLEVMMCSRLHIPLVPIIHGLICNPSQEVTWPGSDTAVTIGETVQAAKLCELFHLCQSYEALTVG
jgi:hypothetical protein